MPARSLQQLEKQQLLPIQDGMGLTITVCAGAVWITQDADLRDIILHAGERFTLDRPGLTLVNAVNDALVSVSADPAAGCAGEQVQRLAAA